MGVEGRENAAKTPADDWRPDVYEYVDYRAYLRDYYTIAKEHLPAFSFRYFSRKAGFKSPNFLKLVIDGQRSLGADSVERFCRALQLGRDEKRFFRSLVTFAQAKSPAEKNDAFEQVSASRRFRKARRLDGALFDYLSHWYYPAIREMAGRADFKEDPRWIARELLPPIRPAQARAALDVLIELGVLVRDGAGKLTRGDPTLTTGHEVHSLAIANYHRQMLERAAESIEIVGSEARDLSALTICIAAGTVDEVKERIHEFREQLLNRCDADAEPNVVYQLNMQFFPLNRRESSPED